MNLPFRFILVAMLFSGPAVQVQAAEGTGPTAPGQSSTKGGKVDINTADIPTLESVPEIGTNFANAVVAGRPFKSVEDLERVLKIGPEKMASLRPKVIASPVKAAPSTPSEAEKKPTPSAKPSKPNDGKATDRKEVEERYEPGAGKSAPKK